MRSGIPLMLLCAVGLAAANLVARGPLSQAEILDMVRSGTSSESIVEAIEQNGVGFRPEKGFLKELRKTGAAKDVIKAIKKAAKPGQIGRPRVYGVGNGVSAPQPIFTEESPNSSGARKEIKEGTVVVWVTVNARGDVTEVKLVKSFDKDLDASAVETIRTWKFKPALRNGIPVSCKVLIEVTFRRR